jgi:serine phosphatase RsbU (regulator of sigma subunit)
VTRRIYLWTFAACAACGALAEAVGAETVATLFSLAAGALLLVGLGFLVFRLFQRFLWRVGRRLAFSYFLIGVVPIPLLALLLGVLSLVVAGFFTGQAYRAAVSCLHTELRAAALARVGPRAEASPIPGIGFALYRDGRRVGGDERAPLEWPAWLTKREEEAAQTADALPPFLLLRDDSIAMAATASAGRHGVLALTAGDLAAQLRALSGVWVQFERGEGKAREAGVQLRIGKRTHALTLGGNGGESPDAAREFFGWKPGLWQRDPLIAWADLTAPLLRAADGGRVEGYFGAGLRSSPAAIRGLLFSGNAELRSAIWVSLITLTALLTDLYVVAVLMAAFLIFGLSRAVNRLSAATEAIRKGDFRTRIKVRRRDQLGALQTSFNEMSEHLQGLVATAAQKEALENELAVARSLQTSLLPQRLQLDPRVDVAAYFEPSAAIGGDYYDLLLLPGERLAIFIADVSGHGLPAGLRMAMIKAGVNLLAAQGLSAREILGRLDTLVRGTDARREFVTASLAILDLTSGELEVTNAGHPPVYLARAGGGVEEAPAQGSPLGGLGRAYGQSRLTLRRGDCAVWLSDGLIEATDATSDAFGYDGILTCARAEPTAQATLDGILGAVARHTAGRAVEDDRTLLALRWLG